MHPIAVVVTARRTHAVARVADAGFLGDILEAQLALDDAQVPEQAVAGVALGSRLVGAGDLVLMGGYVQGQDQDLDVALSLWPDILSFLQQDQSEENSYEDACNSLAQLVGHLT